MNIDKRLFGTILLVSILSSCAFTFTYGNVLAGVFVQKSMKYTLEINDDGLFIDQNVPSQVTIYKNGLMVADLHNVMTNIGEKWIIFQTFNSSYTKLTWNVIAIGTGTQTAATATKLNVGNAISSALAPGTSGNCQWWASANTWGLNNTFTGLTATETEAGIFNSTATNYAMGTCAWYVTGFSVTLASTDTLLICWKGTTSGT